MTRKEFNKIENYMLKQMKDSAHDKYHIYRVLYSALDIAETENDVDLDVLIAACLLHDIGRQKQFENLELCHAKIGSEMAYEYLIQNNWNPDKAQHVKNCIHSHRYRKENEPGSIEAKILFDADKLDVTGALGIARTLAYGSQISEPLYILNENNEIVVESTDAELSSFFQEYNYKLRDVYNKFYTKRAKQISTKNQKTASEFYDSLLSQISKNQQIGLSKLQMILNE